MKYSIFIVITIECVNALIFTNSNQTNFNVREKRAVIHDGRLRWHQNCFRYYIKDKLNENYIFNAHQLIQKHTCLKFIRIFDKEKAHLLYMGGALYLTHLGKENETNHKIIIDRDNMDAGKIARETLRALGIDYEHKRPDRDHFINVIQHNIPKIFFLLFCKEPVSEVTPLGLSYEYRSIMHFGTTELCKYRKTCIKSKSGSKLVDALMGNKMNLAFNDAKLVNLVYCSDIKYIRTSGCQNFGYPRTYSDRCICLRYFTGKKCQLTRSSYHYCNRVNVFYASTYLHKVTLLARYNCYYYIKAPEGKKIYLELRFSYGSRYKRVCNVMEHIEVLHREDYSVTGSLICPQILPHIFVSESNIIIIHTKYQSKSYNIQIHFKLM
uniref:Metalloendopeptidase n=1 Tax=Strongyloides papillosus TaxID=174720 RepID=A0A0N5BS79_STREA